MRNASFHLVRAASIAALTLGSSDLRAQGVTTLILQGSVRSSEGAALDGVEITVVHTGTGFRTTGVAREGRFLIPGLEAGGPYDVSARHLGFRSQELSDLFLMLGKPLELAFVLEPDAIPLDTLRVSVPVRLAARDDGGTATTLPESLLHRLPTLDRDFYDFIRLVPQISTKVGFQSGFAGGGVGFRFNNILINGVPERSLAAHATPALFGGKSLPLEAVKEYEVLIAPYDVRYGDFAGALVNTVTRRGTNELFGNAFVYTRSDDLAGQGDFAARESFERTQYGFSIGGPVVRDRLHYFLASELQHFTYPAPGPYAGQPAEVTPVVPVSAGDMERLIDVLDSYGLRAGSAGSVENGNPLTNLFARVDLAIPEWNSRAALWTNYAGTGELSFSRLAPDTFSLSTYQLERKGISHLTSFQMHSELGANVGHNELLLSYKSEGGDFRSEVDQSIVRVVVPATSGGFVTVNTGTHEAAHAVSGRAWRFNAQDNTTLPLGANHVVTLGFTGERFHDQRQGVMGSYGTWTFPSLDALEDGIAERYEIRKDLGSARVATSGWYYGVHVGDQWYVGDAGSVTIGLRADAMTIDERAPYNAEVDSIFQRRTDEMPSLRPHFSPRIGFTWDPEGTGAGLLRGGIGIFTGRPPLHWLRSALTSYGIGIGVLRCGRLSIDRGPPPEFEPDYRAAPTECANGSGIATAPRGDVDLLSHDLTMARSLRTSLAYDRVLPWEMFGTIEVLFTKNLTDYVFANLNLAGPQGVDRDGRVMYGTIESSALSVPALRSNFSEVIDLQNVSRNYAFQASASMERRFRRGIGGIASYTFTRVRDAQTPLRTGTPGSVNWSSRAVSGLHEDWNPGISTNDIPHRIVLAGTYEAPWKRWSTVISFSYVAESGGPFTYLAWGAGRRGDLNADGSNGNDPIYVPRDAFDPNEIAFSGRSESEGADNSPDAQAERIRQQRSAFERFIEETPCLREQRGHILERNRCREPWSHTTTLTVRQRVPIAGQSFDAQLDVFNFVNLLRDDWGTYRVAAPALLEHVGQGPGSLEVAQPVFRFDPTRPKWTILAAESAFQLQLAVRYSF